MNLILIRLQVGVEPPLFFAPYLAREKLFLFQQHCKGSQKYKGHGSPTVLMKYPVNAKQAECKTSFCSRDLDVCFHRASD